MEKHFNDVLNILKQQDIDGCITGSIMLGFQKDWKDQQDIDLFCYDKPSFNKLLFFMHYNPMFQILNNLEKYKFDEFVNSDKSSLDSIGLITIKFKYNLLIDVNVVLKKFQNNIFDVLSNFDLDIIAQGYDIKTKRTLSLRETTNLNGTWNKWNKSFYNPNQWECKRFLRQFLRICKYTERGFDLTSVTDKYISMIEEILSKDNVYTSQRGVSFYEKTQKEFNILLKILKLWKKNQKMSDKHKLILQTLI